MSSSGESGNKNAEQKDTDLNPAKVHSANSWEQADLGDEERKKKFLKLMGAAKAEHSGRFVIGEKELPTHPHARDKKETEEINQELEDQFKHTLEHRVTRWSHKGLGFDDADKNVSEDSNSSYAELRADKNDKTDKSAGEKKDNGDSKTTQKSDENETTGKKRTDSTDKEEISGSPPKKPKMMMNFVKSSD